MANHFSPYPTVTTLRSQLLTSPPPSVPPIEDLINLETELKLLRNKSLARYKKAETDYRTLDLLYRQCKEKDKDRDKFKVKEKIKIKREATETPDVNSHSVPASTPSSLHNGGYGVKVIPGTKSNGGSVNTAKDKLKKDKDRMILLEKERKKDSKKKKRKREDEDSDVEEALAERHKKLKRSPEPPSLTVQKHKSPVKPLHTSSVPTSSSNFFALPRHVPHIPQRPVNTPAPIAGPSSPKQVQEDFSKQKPPQQIAVATFWSYVEPWLRPIREEDVGLLEWDGDEETPFIVPPLRRHYTELWEDEDSGRFNALASSTSPKPTPKTASLPKWDPLTLQESDLVSSDKGHSLGPVHERLLSAMLPVPVLADGKPAASGNVKPSLNGVPRVIDPSTVDERIAKMKPFDGDKQPPRVNIQDMQERLIKELRLLGLLGDEEPDYSKTADDPLAVELRQCQRLLRAQMTVNKARRQRLCEIAKARLARNEFEEHLAALERSILAKYNQLQKRDMPKQAKKKKKSGGAGGGAHVVPDGPFLPPAHIHPAAWGLEKDEDCHLGVDEELNDMILMRQRFIDLVQPCLDTKERERPGTLYGSPQDSIYKGIQIPKLPHTITANGKGP